MRRLGPLAALAMLLLTAPVGGETPTGDDPILRALGEELARSMEKLRLEGLEEPYFVAYRVDDVTQLSASASFGSLVSGSESRTRMLSVELRVGDYELDNTNFLSFPTFSTGMVRYFGGVTQLPLDDDDREIRRQAWLATDAAFKQALEDMAKKKAVLQTRKLAEELPDFSKEEPLRIEDRAEPTPVDLRTAESLVVKLSGLFRELPAIFDSTVSFSAGTTDTRFVNSEGSSYRRIVPETRLTVSARTQAADALPLEDSVSLHARRPAELPPPAELEAWARGVGERLTRLREAELLERYNGPVLFEGRAAAELFARGFATQLPARRRPLTGNEQLRGFLEQVGPGEGFQDRLGARVLPRFLSVVDAPTRRDYEGTALLGSYAVDDQGVAARDKAVIERGYLKTLLADRTPVTGVSHSTGNSRGGAVAPANLVVTADRGLSGEELRRELLLLVQDRESEFGIVVRRLTDPGAGLDPRQRILRMAGGGGREEGMGVLVAYKVYPDGREEALRNVEISGLSSSSFKEIVAAGAESEVHHLVFPVLGGSPFGFNPIAWLSGGSAGGPIVSVVVPPLLFEELSLKKPGGEVPTLPVAGHPFFAE